MTLKELAERLTNYDGHEARSIVRRMLEDCFELSFTDICCGALDRLSEEETARLELCMSRLEGGEPVQYVTGCTTFLDRTFRIGKGALIPRPETEELCEWIIAEYQGREGVRLLDIGTGSGCIAISLAMALRGAVAEGWDISDDALAIACRNATELSAGVTMGKVDILTLQPVEEAKWDVIVSNPPYICNAEAAEMERNVLDHEPHTALFVPDDDPLLFYRAICHYARKTLKEGGALYFEINPLFAADMEMLMRGCGFREVETRGDQFGKQRMMRGRV